MTLNEKLDTVLFFLKERTDLGTYYPKEYIWIHYISLTPEFKINQQLFDEIFERLLQDGFVRKREIEEAKPTYHLTIKGREFKGYVEEEQLISLSKRNEKDLQTHTLLASQGTTKWTKWIALLTLGLFVVALIVLLKDCSSTPK